MKSFYLISANNSQRNSRVKKGEKSARKIKLLEPTVANNMNETFRAIFSILSVSSLLRESTQSQAAAAATTPLTST